MKRIFFVTPGETLDGYNPFMTKKGYQDVAALKSQIPESPAYVVSGLGNRHTSIANALEIERNRISELVGLKRKCSLRRNDKITILPGSKAIDKNDSLERAYLRDLLKEFLKSLPSETVICTGQCFGLLLQLTGISKNTFENASVYQILIDGDEFFFSQKMKKVANY